MTDSVKKTQLLVILDGWGYREAPEDNAIINGNTPVWDRLWAESPHTLISGSGLDVGLPAGQMGNSEVGHMSLGSGRVIYQNMTRIDQAIKDGSFFDNAAYTSAVDKAVQGGKAVHLFGLLSEGGVHSHQRHIAAAIRLACERGASQVYLHAFLDGRDTPPRSALASLQAMEETFQQYPCGRIASLVGRYYVMDRDNRWDRVEPAYRMLTEGVAAYSAGDARSALEMAYARDEDDEFVQTTTIIGAGDSPVVIADGDAVIFMNFRADRARQITRAFIDPGFDAFDRALTPRLCAFVMTTEYAENLEIPCAYPPEKLANVLPDYLSGQGKTQLRIAETEKYAHVTFFFSGGREDPYPGEDRILVPSPDVATYDLKPSMSAPELTDKLVEAIRSGKYDLIVCNYANGDMVGHTGNYQAAIQAVEALDECLGRVEQALLEVSGEGLVTADHGNCEQMVDYESGQLHTQHTTEPVPLVYIGKRAVRFTRDGGVLADVAPSLLHLMGMVKPVEMTGQSLLEIEPA